MTGLKIKWIHLLLLFLYSYQCITIQHCMKKSRNLYEPNTSHFEVSICIPENYNKLEKPFEKTTVTMSIVDMKVLDVNDSENTITMYFNMYFAWREPRLGAPPVVDDYFPLNHSFLELLWLPDIFIYNLKSIKKHTFIHDVDFR